MTIATKAFSKIKNYDKYTAALAKTEEELKEAQKPLPRSDRIDSLVDVALSDDPFPTDVISGAEDHDRASRNATARVRLLKEAVKQLKQLRTETAQDHSDPALSFLSEKLAALVDEVRSISHDIPKTATADTILRSGDMKQMDAWNCIDSLITRYGEIRNTQEEILRLALPSGDLHKMWETGIFRNSLDWSPFWQQQRNRGRTPQAARDSDQGVRDYNEWLVSFTASSVPHTRSIWPTEDRKSYLLSICTETDLWLPSVGDLALAHKAASTAVSPVDYSKLKETEEARDRFYEITRSKPATPYTRSKSAGPPAPRRSDRRKAGLNALLNR